MPDHYDNRWQRFAPSKPRPVDDGIATSKQRGAMAEQWWSKRFVDVLESYGLGGRMQRGRRYARSGQLLSLDVAPGLLMAQIQGSRSQPYVASVRLREMTDEQWGQIEAELQSRVGLIAALSAGEVPEALVDAFEAAGVALFPLQWGNLRATCNCPDPANPCKHLAAVLYVFADQLDSDPWLLLRWRGRTRDEILDLLRSPAEVATDESVAPWWPFASGPIPQELLVGAPDDWPLPAAGRGSVLDRLDPLDVDVRGTLVADLVLPAYNAIITTDDDG